ncbi:alpha/beta hydrolase [Muriicola marianensis]|uniref:Alpha/beta hydrolase n=1 Tax=Muriicola marianensis TaxID=1324801 RepID=A0ABQ1QR24_9FLAO|nr:alpha/beta fold hydrolase [Muriicola marianensis]GGD38697.1 alpha/beta hydrolase [Muriicola marianensis]
MRSLRKAVLALISGVLLFLSMLYFLQEKLIFLPEKLPKDYTYSFREPFEEFYLERPDGARLNALHFKREDPRGVILYFHGNAGNLSRWGEVVQNLVRLNYDLVVMDYRTYGKSKGKLSEKALLEDARAFYEYLQPLYKSEDIILYGRSLGTAMASYVASENQISILILETPFHSLLDVARHRFPVLPVESFLKYPFRNYEFLHAVESPIVILHGDRDEVVPIKSAYRLRESLEGKSVQFIEIKGGGHNNLSSFQRYHEALSNILQPSSQNGQ